MSQSKDTGRRNSSHTNMRVYSFFGLILLAIGVVVFLYAQNGIQEYQTASGQLARSVSGQHQEQFQMYSMARIGGGVIAILGLGEMILN